MSMWESFWAWVSASDFSQVVTVILGPTSVIGIIVAAIIGRAKGQPPKKSQEHALTTATSPDSGAAGLARQALDLATATSRELEVERAARRDLRGEVERLRASRESDGIEIRSLRDAVQTFMAWGTRIHAQWDEIRQQPKPPDLPDINID